MNKNQWQKRYHLCRFKFHDEQNLSGNTLCGYVLPIGSRCMYRKCPFVRPTRVVRLTRAGADAPGKPESSDDSPADAPSNAARGSA